jgi:hypothetical protein
MEITNCTGISFEEDLYSEEFVDDKILDKKVSEISKEILDDVSHPRICLSSLVHMAEVIEKLVDIVENNESYCRGSQVDQKIRDGGQIESEEE